MERLTFDSGYYHGKKDSQDEVERLRAENARLTQWISDLQSGMYVNCVYCGHRYGPGETTPVSMADALKAHVEQCPKHPMSALKTENERLRAGVAESDKLICSLIERYEFDGDSEDANPCEWCSRNNCDSCRRMTDDDSLMVRFEMADLGFMEARAALEKEDKCTS